MVYYIGEVKGMYPHLFGNSELLMYDLIGILGYLLIVPYFLWKKTWPVTLDGETTAKRRALLTLLPLLVHLVSYTFGGLRLAALVERGTDFFGYVAISALGMVLAAVALGARPLNWLDKTAPLYPATAAVLKFSCFCAGCCYGLPWDGGLYNHRTQQREFPIQLVESALCMVLCLLISRYKGRPGQRFALFLTGYAGVRFMLQFFRGDLGAFTPFHWMSGAFLAIGVVLWVAVTVAGKAKKPEEREE